MDGSARAARGSGSATTAALSATSRVIEVFAALQAAALNTRDSLTLIAEAAREFSHELETA
ncbi:hypothetical protein ACIRL0_21780 [Streptomyces sp. NPDC102365]|uniref:hypothetical protein n=1 Tax=Streptomyces sp. NPDC102365 TaxID=3366162 RepID=UPI003830A3CF